jgi:hypothetical protein
MLAKYAEKKIILKIVFLKNSRSQAQNSFIFKIEKIYEHFDTHIGRHLLIKSLIN